MEFVMYTRDQLLKDNEAVELAKETIVATIKVLGPTHDHTYISQEISYIGCIMLIKLKP